MGWFSRKKPPQPQFKTGDKVLIARELTERPYFPANVAMRAFQGMRATVSTSRAMTDAKGRLVTHYYTLKEDDGWSWAEDWLSPAPPLISERLAQHIARYGERPSTGKEAISAQLGRADVADIAKPKFEQQLFEHLAAQYRVLTMDFLAREQVCSFPFYAAFLLDHPLCHLHSYYYPCEGCGNHDGNGNNRTHKDKDATLWARLGLRRNYHGKPQYDFTHRRCIDLVFAGDIPQPLLDAAAKAKADFDAFILLTPVTPEQWRSEMLANAAELALVGVKKYTYRQESFHVIAFHEPGKKAPVRDERGDCDGEYATAVEKLAAVKAEAEREALTDEVANTLDEEVTAETYVDWERRIDALEERTGKGQKLLRRLLAMRTPVKPELAEPEAATTEPEKAEPEAKAVPAKAEPEAATAEAASYTCQYCGGALCGNSGGCLS